MAQGYWVVRTVISGPVGEKIKFFVPGVKPPKSQRRLKAEIRKQQQNEANAVRRAARLVNANFTHRDFLTGENYSAESLQRLAEGLDPASESYEEELFHRAVHDRKLWIRRVVRKCKKEGVPFRYIAITSDMDGKTGEYRNPHHHVIINEEAMEIALGEWKKGSTYRAHVWSSLDKTPLAQYLLQQVRRLPDEKKYSSSRNLVRPQPKDRIARSDAEVTPPRGTRLVNRSEYIPGRPQYIRYLTAEALGTVPQKRKKDRHGSDGNGGAAYSARGG